MPKYIVTREYSGYVRGWESREVIADSPKEAEQMFHSGKEVDVQIVRDDTNTNGYSVEESLSPSTSKPLTPAQQVLYNSIFGKLP